jgi:inosose dehydratase
LKGGFLEEETMMMNHPNRREFLKASLLATAAVSLHPALNLAESEKNMQSFHLATNQYPWGTFYQREKRDFFKDLDLSLGEVAASGFEGYEPLAESPAAIDRLALLLAKHHLEMRSLYVNSSLHEEKVAEKSFESVIQIAGAAKQKLGTRIIVTNPNPIRWGGQENKSDAQLRLQAKMLNRLGIKLTAMGLKLAYHNHDPELRMAARELHHMMMGTDPVHVDFCLDSHWIYRGAGNSNVALFDIVKMYGARVAEWHLRQSHSGIWTESFGEGDIDYKALAVELKKAGARPHLVLEQAVEAGSPNTMNGLEAHKKSVAYARLALADLAG